MSPSAAIRELDTKLREDLSSVRMRGRSLPPGAEKYLLKEEHMLANLCMRLEADARELEKIGR